MFNEGRMQRDFTHVSDIVSGILGALAHPADGPVPHRVFNLGNLRRSSWSASSA